MTHYETLRVPRDASPEQIKHAFRERALQTHPDLRRGRPADIRRASQEFDAPHRAYVTLIDPVARAAYDAGRNLAEQAMHQAETQDTVALRHERRVVPPIPPYRRGAAEDPEFADEMQRQIWREPLVLLVSRTVWSALGVVVYTMLAGLFVYQFLLGEGGFGYRLSLLFVIPWVYLISGLWLRWRRIEAAGGWAHAWHTAGRWRGILRMRDRSSRPVIPRWRLIRVGVIVHLLPILTVICVFVEWPDRPTRALAIGGILLPVEAALLAWFWSRVFRTRP